MEGLLRIATRWGSRFFNALLVGVMAATLAIATLYALRRDRAGIVGVVFSVGAFVGLALMLWGELGEPRQHVVVLHKNAPERMRRHVQSAFMRGCYDTLAT